jgi:hypothetical protein
VFDVVVLNLLPHDADRLLGRPPARSVPDGWGAAMHYLAVRDAPAWSASPRHAILADDLSSKPTHGHQVFASLAARTPMAGSEGLRALTLSTHLEADASVATVEEVQARMLATLRTRWPEVADAIEADHPASPRTFTRFVRRTGGYVGGPIRRPTWRVALDAFPAPIAPGAWRVGDSGFPGQSTLATFLGGERVAAALGGPRR